VLKERQGIEKWRKVRDVEFDLPEARDAADFEDLMENYGIEGEDLCEYIDSNLKVGHRLFLAESLPMASLGVFIMSDDDDRIVKVAQLRVVAERIDERIIVLDK